MKRILLALTTLTVLLALVSCSGDQPDSDTTTPADTDSQTVTTTEASSETTPAPTDGTTTAVTPDETTPGETVTDEPTDTTTSSPDTTTAVPETTGPVVYEPKDFILTAESVITDDPAAGYPSFKAKASSVYLVPGLNQYFVPQGMDVWADMNWLMISGYFSDTRFSSCSMVLALDMTSGEFVGEYQLKNRDGSDHTGHAGGIAITPKNMFISTGSKLLRIPLADVLAADRKGSIRIVEEISVPVRASFCNYSGGYLWVGDFYYDPGYLTDSYRHMTNLAGKMYYAWSVGYVLDEGEENEFSADKWKTSMPYATPDVVLSIDKKIQGFTYIPGRYIVLSQSYGRTNDSHIYLYKDLLVTAPHKTVELNGKSVPLWFLDSKTGVIDFTAMPMAEGVASANEKLYILFESGAEKYRGNGKNPTDYVWMMSFAK